ncbi:MAG: ribosome silencing factor [Chitinophagaceae bacterium]|nr:ribosome silencing factor [Chitinophagaceae bacterium]
MRTSLEAPVKQKSSLTYNSKIIKTIIAAIQDKKGEEIVSLNLKKIPESIADFFIVCEANNPNLLKAIADNVEKMVHDECEEKPYHFEGKQGDKWILIDYVNVVVHCLLPETRGFYNLEDLWQDAERKQHDS